METLNKTSTKVFNKIIEGLDENNTSKKINNNESFQPLCVDFLGKQKSGTMYSFAHYFEQNGDLVPDPDMTFLSVNGFIVPCTFQNQLTYTEGFNINTNTLRPKSQKSITSFANMWMKNIKHQQNIKV